MTRRDDESAPHQEDEDLMDDLDVPAEDAGDVRGGLDATSNEAAVEGITIVHEGLDRR